MGLKRVGRLPIHRGTMLVIAHVGHYWQQLLYLVPLLVLVVLALLSRLREPRD